jgi:asparagine synthase (glutamine-hydrolysing)
MCGIFGVIDHPSIDRDRFKNALALLHHRGPDFTDAKFWERAAFGFTRLAIQDLSPNGNQPMTLLDNSLTIVFNGEIYNHKILREKLKSEGAQFFSRSDTEVILHAFRCWGWEKTLHAIEGMFGMAIYDHRKGTFYLARDRFGQKPLFFSQDSKFGFVFASELKSIVAYVGSANMDPRSCMNPLFTTGLSPRGKSCFRGIEQLESGEFLQYQLASGKIIRKKYFQVGDLISEDLYQELNGYSQEKMLETYEKVFDESVQLHLLSDAPLASLFSAGIDSALIVALAARHTSLKLYHFESEHHDFQKIYKPFAKQFQLPLKLIKQKDSDYIFRLPRLIWHYETICKPDGVVLGHLCEEAYKDGVKVLLTGDSSDELFGGYSTAVEFALSSEAYHSSCSSFFQRGLNKIFPNNFSRYPISTPLGTTYNSMPSWPHLNEVPLNYFYHHGTRLEEWKDCLESYSFIEDPNEREVSAFLLDEIGYRLQRFMVRADRFGMMNSVELRLPFLFTPLVKLAVNTPQSWRVRKKILWRGRETKYIVKRLANKLGIRRSLIYRKKIGTPFDQDHYVRRLLENWDLDNLAGLLEIPVTRLRKIALESFGRDIERIQHAFISMEILIRLFVHGESYEEITEQFKAICR